jgi:purine-nucleoside phosphorylase
MENKLRTALEVLKNKIGNFVPEVAIIPGSGWDKIIGLIEDPLTVEYSELPFFPKATFHRGMFVFGTVEGVKVVSAGRLHYYEGIDVAETVMPLRLLRMLGTKKLLLTNASGGINPAFAPGSFMVIEDHISFAVPSPLRGTNPDFLGPRFPDMSCVYSKRFREAIFKGAAKAGIPLEKGIYVQTAGPQFETPAEIRFLRAMGADAVGMSTVPEAIAAVHCGMEVAGISCISNMAAGISEIPLSVEDINNTAQKAIPQMLTLLKESIVEISQL